MEEFKKIVEASPGRLMVFDLYADWCGPCRVLSPILEQIAQKNSDKADFYKINVDHLPQLASSFKVRGIPHVAFLRDNTILHTIVGVRPKSTYLNALKMFAEKEAAPPLSQTSGQLINGTRVIRFKAEIHPHSLYVFRGETVKLIIEKQDFPFSVHIPAFNISKEAEKNQVLELNFKAKAIGVYPIFCNGNCPAGDGAMQGKIIVMQYKGNEKAHFEELTAVQAKDLIKEKTPLILDVRTPQEYYNGHLEGAKLIPLQQLIERLSEIQDYSDREILVYCRSGNRSTVAGEILIQKGFKKIYNLRPGIKGWIKNKFEVQQEKTQPVI